MVYNGEKKVQEFGTWFWKYINKFNDAPGICEVKLSATVVKSSIILLGTSDPLTLSPVLSEMDILEFLLSEMDNLEFLCLVLNTLLMNEEVFS